MNYFEQAKDWTKLWSNPQTNLFQSWIEGKGHSPFPPGSIPSAEAGEQGWRQMNELIKRSMESWATFAQAGSPQQGGQTALDAGTFARLFDPAEWNKAMATGADLSLERLTEGPTYATPTDLDRKLVRAQKLWLQRAKDIEGYRAVVQGAWTRAFEQFTQALGTPDAAPLKSWRAVLDLWLSIANDALLGLHHRPEFLEAQRRMTRSAAEYRLQERELAEVFCAANHIPTRTEMDEAQRTIHELRRELRALRRDLGQGKKR